MNPTTPSNAMRLAAIIAFRKNQEMNAAKREYDAARKELFAMMEDAQMESFSISETDPEGNRLELTSVVQTPEVTRIDVVRLRDQVTPDVFLKIVTATKTAVTDHAGKLVAESCLVTEEGTRNVTIKGTLSKVTV